MEIVNQESTTPETNKPIDPYRVSLDSFEGPLDLLLHLIKTNDLDIYDIPIALVLKQYLEYLELANELNVDLAGDFLLTAAELIHIKSRMLMPLDEGEEEEEGPDPRAELVRRLLEYQKYKEAGRRLLERPMLGKDVFVRGHRDEIVEGDETLDANITSLLLAFQKVLTRLPQETAYEIKRERASVQDKILELTERLTGIRELKFLELFDLDRGRSDVVVTFLSLLEMAKMNMISVRQGSVYDEIFIVSHVEAAETGGS